MLKWTLKLTNPPISSETYLLSIRFSESITRLFNKIWESEELTNFVEEQWNQPIIKLPKTDNVETKKLTNIHLVLYKIPYLEKEDWIYISCKDFIIYSVWLCIPNFKTHNSSLFTINSILNWGIRDNYYVIWDKWKNLLDRIISDKTSKTWSLYWLFIDAKDKHLKVYHYDNFNMRDFHILESSWWWIDVTNVTDNDIKNLYDRYLNYWHFLYFEDKALKEYAKYLHNAQILEWLNEIFIHRETIRNQNLLISTLYSLYSKNDIYLYYSPTLLDMNITEKKLINIKTTESYNIINFSEVIRSISHFEKTKEYLENIIWNNIIETDNVDDIKRLLDRMFQDIIKIWANNVIITAKWIVNDKNRFDEINNAVKRWKISIRKDNREKKYIEVSFKDSLHDFLKRERKNLESD